jgi:hypothetical protein
MAGDIYLRRKLSSFLFVKSTKHGDRPFGSAPALKPQGGCFHGLCLLQPHLRQQFAGRDIEPFRDEF